jgi:hypothetical protein
VTKAELVQEVIDRGYDYESSGRVGRSIDRAHRRICSRRNWPFLEAETTGTAPLEIADLRWVLSVKTDENPVQGVDRRWLVSTLPNLTDTGTPAFWYLEDQTLNVYPVDPEASLTVRYKKRPAVMADGDEPLVPEEWQYLIVDLAVIDFLKDDDEYSEAVTLRTEVLEGIKEMASDLLGRNLQNVQTVNRTGAPGDYLG